MEGVYVVSPTADAVNAIKRDFRSPSEALYSSAHLFFLERVPADLLQSIKQCSTLVSRIKSFKASFYYPLVLVPDNLAFGKSSDTGVLLYGCIDLVCSTRIISAMIQAQGDESAFVPVLVLCLWGAEVGG